MRYRPFVHKIVTNTNKLKKTFNFSNLSEYNILVQRVNDTLNLFSIALVKTIFASHTATRTYWCEFVTLPSNLSVEKKFASNYKNYLAYRKS